MIIFHIFDTYPIFVAHLFIVVAYQFMEKLLLSNMCCDHSVTSTLKRKGLSLRDDQADIIKKE